MTDVADDNLKDHLEINIDGVVASEGEEFSQFTLNYNQGLKSFEISTITKADDVLLIEIIVSQVSNPENNKPFTFAIEQYEANNRSRVYAYGEAEVKMTELDLITVTQAERNTSKILDNIEMKLEIETPDYEGKTMRIKFSPGQVKVLESELCKLFLDGEEQNVGIDPEEITNDIYIMHSWAGKHEYLISGCLKNSEFSETPEEEDKIYISLDEPHQVAETTPESTVFITPLTTTGALAFSNLESSSNKRLSYTTISFTIEPENFQSCDGLVV